MQNPAKVEDLQEKDRISQGLIDELCGLVWHGKNEEAKRLLLPRLDVRILNINTPNSERGTLLFLFLLFLFSFDSLLSFSCCWFVLFSQCCLLWFHLLVFRESSHC
jgi:hypothetical protein